MVCSEKTYHGEIKLKLYEVVTELLRDFLAISVQMGIFVKLTHLDVPLEDVIIHGVGRNT